MKDFSMNKWGLILAGGGGKGAYQIGVMRALREKGIDKYITGVSGSSVGALNGVLFAYNDQPLAEDVWWHIKPEQFIGIAPDMIDMKEGLVPRDGILDIVENYIDLDKISMNARDIYATTTEYDEYGMGQGRPKYHSLNYKTKGEITNILLASSALPIIYEPVVIEGKMHRDGGLTDNLPIAPLYAEGIRHFIVVGLSPSTQLPEYRFEDADFLMIKPHRSIGDFVDGTLDFSQEGARYRMENGYIDAIRELDFSDKDMSDEGIQMLYQASVDRDYSQINFEIKKASVDSMVNEDMNKIDELIKKYT